MTDDRDDDFDDETSPAEVASDKIPVYPASDGTAYMHASHVVQLLRGIAGVCRDTPGRGLPELAEAIDQQADSIDIRAIDATHG